MCIIHHLSCSPDVCQLPLATTGLLVCSQLAAGILTYCWHSHSLLMGSQHTDSYLQAFYRLSVFPCLLWCLGSLLGTHYCLLHASSLLVSHHRSRHSRGRTVVLAFPTRHYWNSALFLPSCFGCRLQAWFSLGCHGWSLTLLLSQLTLLHTLTLIISEPTLLMSWASHLILRESYKHHPHSGWFRSLLFSWHAPLGWYHLGFQLFLRHLGCSIDNSVTC